MATKKELIKEGINYAAKVVGTTLGPLGKNVLISNQGDIHITKDGATIINALYSKNPIKNIGIELLKQAANRTVVESGDSTTQTCLLAHQIITQGYNTLEESNINIVTLSNQINQAVADVVKYLKDNCTNITEDNIHYLKNIATIAANNDEQIGNTIYNTIKTIGLYGIIEVMETEYNSIYTDTVRGMKLNTGYASPVFINNMTKNNIEFENPYVLIYDKKIMYSKELYKDLERLQSMNVPIVIIAHDYDTSVLSYLSVNNANNTIQVCPIKAPGFGDRRINILKDIEIFTEEQSGNTFIADKIIINQDSTYIIKKEVTDKVQKRAELLKEMLANSKDYSEIIDLNKRIASLVGGIATIYIGANSEAETKELKDRYDDAVCAVKAAIEGGVSPGGGNAFFLAANNRLLQTNKDPLSIGEVIIYNAIISIIKQNYHNAGLEMHEGDKMIEFLSINTLPNAIGTNLITNHNGNLFDMGIVDSTKSLCCALKNAASVATLFLSTDHIISK